MIILKEETKILALSKLFNYIKFECVDPDCLMFAASPIINQIYDEIIEYIQSEFPEKIKSVKSSNNIEDYSYHLLRTEQNIQRLTNWNNLTIDIKRVFILELIHPYKINDKVINLIINNGDQFHKKDNNIDEEK